MMSALLSGASARVGWWLLLKCCPSRRKILSSIPPASARRASIGTSRRQSDDHSSEMTRILAGPPGWAASHLTAATCDSSSRAAGDAADHHAGERLRLVRRGERDLGSPEERAHRVVHVEPRGGLHDARTELPRLLLRGDHDGVAGAVQRKAVFLAARRRVGERRVDLHQLVRHAERVEDLNDAFIAHGRIRVMPWPASVKATVAPGASGASTGGPVTNSPPISESIEYSMRDPR